MDKERFAQQLAFSLELDKEKNVFRQTHLSGGGRRENDAEHAWHMAIMAWILREYANEEIDLARTMLMILIHDVVEIDAGDTYAYDEEAKKTQAEREAKAAERIFGLLPEDQRDELRALFEEYETQETPEAHIVRSMDSLQPLLLNDKTEGRDWRSHGVRMEQVIRRQEPGRLGSEKLWEFSKALIERNTREGKILK